MGQDPAVLVSVHLDPRAEALRPSKEWKLYIAPRQWNSRTQWLEAGSAAGARWGCATIQPPPSSLSDLGVGQAARESDARAG